MKLHNGGALDGKKVETGLGQELCSRSLVEDRSLPGTFDR